jgi:hypothetical protein
MISIVVSCRERKQKKVADLMQTQRVAELPAAILAFILPALLANACGGFMNFSV